ncbi:hypothetical protein HK098_005110 [Nowakowskiella sp. JEL0407]|nr:hypothetical protein HK098_005110 [Nowakowskiella sp. JEL0407]
MPTENEVVSLPKTRPLEDDEDVAGDENKEKIDNESKRLKTDDSTGEKTVETSTSVSVENSTTDVPKSAETPTEKQPEESKENSNADSSAELVATYRESLDPGYYSIEKMYMPDDWLLAFYKEILKPYYKGIKMFLAKEENEKKIIYPPSSDLFSFMKCPIQSIKVVIIGQDPYHGPGQAHGLCFSVREGVRIPPSLRNIYKELQSDLGKFTVPKHGYLQNWCEQGVLMLNASLTVRKSEANSHQNIGWAQFTDAIINYVNQSLDHVVFLLWGKDAQKKGLKINKIKHLVLNAAHPSPFSANNGFFGCKHFSKTNTYLEKNRKQAINWDCLND